jgi:hypothetical protein
MRHPVPVSVHPNYEVGARRVNETSSVFGALINRHLDMFLTHTTLTSVQHTEITSLWLDDQTTILKACCSLDDSKVLCAVQFISPQNTNTTHNSQCRPRGMDMNTDTACGATSGKPTSLWADSCIKGINLSKSSGNYMYHVLYQSVKPHFVFVVSVWFWA